MREPNVRSLDELAAFLEDCHEDHSFAPQQQEVASENPYEIELDDLYHLYTTVRKASCVAILEFGSGWSTLVMALALHENLEFFGAEHIERVRHPNAFQLLTVDASEHWQSIALRRLPTWLKSTVRGVVSSVSLTEAYGCYVHCYDFLPEFTPDLVYLDGPDPEQVVGSVRGFEYRELHTLPMAADLLRLEAHFWPETMLITDGRTANARFLASRLYRTWQAIHDPFGDRTTFRLEETAFGPVVEQHISIRLRASRQLCTKENPNA